MTNTKLVILFAAFLVVYSVAEKIYIKRRFLKNKKYANVQVAYINRNGRGAAWIPNTRANRPIYFAGRYNVIKNGAYDENYPIIKEGDVVRIEYLDCPWKGRNYITARLASDNDE